MNATRSRMAARTADAAGDGSSGARRSRACAATSVSIATTPSAFATARRAFSPASHPMLTWSSVVPDVGIESTDAGTASRLHSATSEA